NQAQRRRTDFGLAVLGLGGADPTIPIAEFAQDSFNIYSKPEIYNNDETKRRLILNGGTLAIGLGLLASEERSDFCKRRGKSAAPRESMFNSGIRTTEPASESLLRAVEGKGRTINYALPGSEELRYLDYMRANANVGGPNMTDILLRQNPTKVEVLEEFL